MTTAKTPASAQRMQQLKQAQAVPRMPDGRTLAYLRSTIPAFACRPGCHDCCGPVTASAEELARLPVKSEQAHAAALDALSCPHLGPHGCEVYEERPLICRLFGTTPRLACPHACGPSAMIKADDEQAIYRFMHHTRQVLV